MGNVIAFPRPALICTEPDVVATIGSVQVVRHGVEEHLSPAEARSRAAEAQELADRLTARAAEARALKERLMDAADLAEWMERGTR